MNRNILLAPVLTLLVLAGLVSESHAVTTPPPLAVVAGLSGQVEITRVQAKRAEQASLGLALRRGDRLQVGPDGAVTLLFNDGNVLDLPAKSAFTMGASAKKPQAAADEMMAGVFKSVSEGVVGGSRERGLVALAPVRGGAREKELILGPRQTEVLEDRPMFRWRKVSGAERYVVTVSSDNGELWKREASDTLLAYPADVPALARGADYVWELRVPGGTGALLQETSGFRVKSQAEAEVVHRHLDRIEGSGRSDGRARNYLAGAYLAGEGLFVDAAERFKTLCAAHPEEPGPHEALGRVYRAIGLSDEAASELQNALTLTRTP